MSVSAILVSAEKAALPGPVAVIVMMVTSRYSRSSRARAGSHAPPESAVAGRTRARMPPLFSFTCVRSMKLDASPALPWPARGLRPLVILRRESDILRCSSGLLPNPANDGIGASPVRTSGFVGLWKGGFMITRSALSCGSRRTSPMSCADMAFTAASPCPCRTCSPVPKSDGCSSLAMRSSEPMYTPFVSSFSSRWSPYGMV